jgi:hypothetical protein
MAGKNLQLRKTACFVKKWGKVAEKSVRREFTGKQNCDHF